MAVLLSYALTTVSDVKESLGISSGDSSKDNLIKRKINQATEMIEGYCLLPADHHFKETTYTNEEYDASNSQQLLLRMRPVSLVTSVQYRNTSLNEDSWTTEETTDYFLDGAAGVLEGNLFYGSYNRWRVSYVAGYETIPADLAEACVILASYLVENAATGSGVKKKQEGSRSIEYHSPNSTNSLVEDLSLDDMLQRYVRYDLSNV